MNRSHFRYFWFQTGQQQKRGADGVAQRVQAQLRVVVVREVIGLESHQRTPRAVIQQFVNRERCDQFTVQGCFEVACGQPYRVTGVGETL